MSYLSPMNYLPHDAPMILLESVECGTDETAICCVGVNRQSVLAPFLNTDGDLPGWYALELMAQTVGVWSGWHRQQQAENNIALGMVLGARELVCESGSFAKGLMLEITVKLLMQDERFGSFECAIAAGEATLAAARVNTFQPSTEELATLFNQRSNA